MSEKFVASCATVLSMLALCTAAPQTTDWRGDSRPASVTAADTGWPLRHKDPSKSPSVLVDVSG
ncbi:hypothetical protein PV392_09635 [Streptomyces sp. ME03-5709C]|nr:hypothetical protein [Streptomyces sp. ME03-5709C]